MDETKTRWYQWIASHAQYFFWLAWGLFAGLFGSNWVGILEKPGESIIATFTVILALSTIGLWRVTAAVAKATRAVVDDAQLRTSQELRAYVTLDKYVGDAIVMFFGDPESRGVKEDALACVKMAIAMQRRMTELAGYWRDSGIQTPLRCRIGIHTDYCTVGNFGSPDRMDYTMIGGAVNLASRLEHEAPAGSILISYETHAHVRDEIHCEEHGNIRVKGIAYPVTTYLVMDLKSNLPAPEPIQTQLPHLKLELESHLMSDDDRAQAEATLRQALDRLQRH